MRTLTCITVGILCSGTLQNQALAQPDNPVEIWPVRDNIYMLVGGGGNTTVQVGADGILVVDTKLDGFGDTLLSRIRSLSDAPIRILINTHAHRDHIGGNAVIAAAGDSISGGNVAAPDGAAVIAHEDVLITISALEDAIPFVGWPTSSYFVARKDLFFNGEPIEILHMPNAHTTGDSLVFFRRSDVISTGDVYNTTGYPVIREDDGGSINGIISALNRIIETTVPEDKQEGGTMVIPGHGRLSDEADVVEYRDMVTIIRDRVQAMIDAGMTLEQVLAAKPSRDYDGRYGLNESWTPTEFIQAIYRTLPR